ncbi:unnamed protein product [Thlaspi arvense]|uniref:Uncharacterized protein n=1 Tax=Thlaspi arvense TaxID=13288 RepID=A0AAU9RP62_THLAR|nr:unnamed protein product [Thlaspi arvense]
MPQPYVYMPKFPDEGHFPSHLKTIFLGGCRLEEDTMPILEKLLHLEEVCLWEGSFSGRRMVFSAVSKIQWARGLKWIVDEGSVPLLHTFQISYCEKLKELSDGLRYHHFLKESELSWYERGMEGAIVGRRRRLQIPTHPFVKFYS